ncbi:MAG TPA: 4Fe-4S binding protein [Nitrospirae bacterium]|nr:4Fe-4S binding protein [Nitrospirota bacterium]
MKNRSSLLVALASAFALLALMFMVPVAHAFDSVTAGEYHIQLITSPEKPRVGDEVVVTVKVLNLSDEKPATRGKVIASSGHLLSDIRENGVRPSRMKEAVEAPEADAFGNYEFKTSFSRAEPHYIKISILEMDGKQYDPPLFAGFTTDVDWPDLQAVRTWTVLLAFVVFSLAAGYLIYRMKVAPSIDPEGFNFLDIPWIKRIFKWKHLQTSIQIPLVVVFAVLIFLAFDDIQDGGKNIATKLIWTIWWAGIIFTFVLVGRLWCFMCPVGAITDWVSRAVRSTRRLPKALRNVWIANLLFIMFTLLDVQLGVVRSPLVTGSLFTGITMLAVGMAVAFERRTFCRYLCPIGGIIGLYSMFSGIELRAKDKQTCREHKQKECYVGNDRGEGCPMFELVPAMDSNNACNFCGECIKTCSKDNITLRARGFFKDAWTTKRLSLDEATLAIVLVGVSIFVTGDMLEPWAGWMASLVNAFPAELLGIDYEYTVEVLTKSLLFFIVALILIPGMLFAASYASNWFVGNEGHNGLKRTFTVFGYMFIPVGLSMHLAHNAGHLLKESLGIVPALQRAVLKYTSFSLGEPDWQFAAMTIVDGAFLYWMQMGIFAVFYVFSIYSGYRLSLNNYEDRSTAFRALVPMLVLSFVLMMANVYLLNLPMAPRHIH